MKAGQIIKPRIGSVILSIIGVFIAYYVSDLYGCKPGPCLATTIHNNCLIYIIIFIVLYLGYNIIYNLIKR